MRTQAAELEERLLANGWRIVERDIRPHWWADELWSIESTWRPVGQRLWLTFLVDPLHEGVRGKEESVWAVGVTSSPPADPADVNPMAVPIRQGWKSHLEQLMTHICQFRDQETNRLEAD